MHPSDTNAKYLVLHSYFPLTSPFVVVQKPKTASFVKPRVLWRQDDNYIHLTINENIDESYKLSWKDKHITFE